MVSPQVVDLFFEDGAPEFFTEELHHVQVIFETGAVFCKPYANIKHMQNYAIMIFINSGFQKMIYGLIKMIKTMWVALYFTVCTLTCTCSVLT